MTIFYSIMIACLLHSVGFNASCNQLPCKFLRSGERQAYEYIRAERQNTDVCFSKVRKQIASSNFQEELFKTDRKYTLDYLDSLDQHWSKPNRSSPFPTDESLCSLEVVFPQKTLPGFLICEVYPQGDRTFTQTDLYLFKIKNGRIYFVSRKLICYN